MLTQSAAVPARDEAADGAFGPWMPPDPGLQAYLREILRHPPLSGDEEDRLLRRWRRGDLKARDILVGRSLRLVPAIARPYLGRGASLLDLIEQGNIGLLRAVEAYDPRGGPFCVLAARQIVRAIATFLEPGDGCSVINVCESLET